MIYLYGYLGIGVVALAVIMIHNKLRDSSATDRSRHRRPWTLRDDVFEPILGFTLIAVIWPLLLYWFVRDVVSGPRVRNTDLPKEFAVTRDHLKKAWTVADIEAAETVVDPLGAAPCIPFGHLNTLWEDFKQSIQEGDQLWSFSATWISEWRCKEQRDGYVILRGETIGPHLLTRLAYADREDQVGKG